MVFSRPSTGLFLSDEFINFNDFFSFWNDNIVSFFILLLFILLSLSVLVVSPTQVFDHGVVRRVFHEFFMSGHVDMLQIRKSLLLSNPQRVRDRYNSSCWLSKV